MEPVGRAGDERGFTLIELVVGLTLLVTVLVSLAKATDGALRGLQSVRARSSYTELANAALESARATSFDTLLIGTTTNNVTTGTTPYTVATTVSWSDPAQQIKKIDVTLSWTEGTAHSVSLSTLRYPGGKGALVSNQQPSAVLTATPTSGHSPLAVSFNASSSTDPDGTIASYAWQFGDGQTSSGSVTSHTYAGAGTYTAVLTVTDNGGLTSVASTTITVSTNHAPIASFTVVETAMDVAVDAGASTDADGDPLTYTWDFGDGSSGSGITATHTYTSFGSTGSYTITLTVNDGTLSGTATNAPCLISTGSFTGPGLNTITLKGGGVSKNSLSFSATSNKNCSTMSITLPSNGGTYVLALNSAGTTTKTWTKSATPNNGYTWTAGQSYTGTFTGSGGSVFTFPFTAS